jgi:hypothetical protein
MGAMRERVLAAALVAVLLAGARGAVAEGLPNTLSVNAGGATMVNYKNGLHPMASDVGVAWARPGVWGGFQVELNDVAFFTTYETQHLIGLRAAWTLRLPHRTLYPFATLGAGVYYSSVISTLPIGQVALGVQRDFPNRLSVSFAAVGWASLFAVGINPRLAVGYAF